MSDTGPVRAFVPRPDTPVAGLFEQMLEYTTIDNGPALGMLVLHDDATREYAYGPALGLPETKVGTFSQALYDAATKQSWAVISMKNGSKRIFPFG